MNIKERRLLNKIKRTHNNLLLKLNLSDKEYWEAVKLFRGYHNNFNTKILGLEIAKKKSKSS